MNQELAELLASVKNRRQLARRAEELLKTDDAYNVIIRGHTLLHAAMNDALRTKATNREAFDKTELGFPVLVHLLAAFDILKHKQSVQFLLKLNTIRNNLAHRAEYEPDIAALDAILPNDIIRPARRHPTADFYLVKWHIINLIFIMQALETQEEATIIRKQMKKKPPKQTGKARHAES